MSKRSIRRDLNRWQRTAQPLPRWAVALIVLAALVFVALKMAGVI